MMDCFDTSFEHAFNLSRNIIVLALNIINYIFISIELNFKIKNS